MSWDKYGPFWARPTGLIILDRPSPIRWLASRSHGIKWAETLARALPLVLLLRLPPPPPPRRISQFLSWPPARHPQAALSTAVRRPPPASGPPPLHPTALVLRGRTPSRAPPSKSLPPQIRAPLLNLCIQGARAPQHAHPPHEVWRRRGPGPCSSSRAEVALSGMSEEQLYGETPRQAHPPDLQLKPSAADGLHHGAADLR